MKKIAVLSICMIYTSMLLAQYDGNTSPTYPELVEIYQKLAKEHSEISLYNMGQSDYGLPIYLCLINAGQDSTSAFEAARSGTTILINNAIHPGEPDGINACLIWINDWIKEGKKTKNLPIIAIIPAYNVGGMMNRSSTSRANQDGPEEYGFRGNAQNLDLNRDCIKMDSENMFTFATIFHALDPDIFLDTHVSNGADYQYTMTYIASVRERMAPSLGNLMHDHLVPDLKKNSAKRGFDLVPYVHLKGETPETGIEVFNDLPRYIMGYASMFNTMSFTLETHMLKPFPQRVQSTLVFIDETINWTKKNAEDIEMARKEAHVWESRLTHYPYNFQLTDQKDSLLFKGYEASYPTSSVTGKERLKYHQDKPYEKYIPYYHHYQAKDSTRIPEYYLLGGQCKEVIRKLEANKIKFQRLTNYNQFDGELIRITHFKSSQNPYEGHFSHSEIIAESTNASFTAKPGDLLIPMDQEGRRFITSVLEPESEDSYFVWNAFDSYVQQKEYFSPYVFEDKAAEILKNNPELAKQLDDRKQTDNEFAQSTWQQLYFIYQNSEFFEPSFNLLPVFKILE